jgi:5-methylcytosine-specific restriction protein A
MSVHVLPRQCREPGCAGKAFQGSRCPRHTRAWVGGQPASAYGPGWATLRAQVLAEQPLCRCGAPATEVDHIMAKAFGGTDARRNLVGICSDCHKRKTAADSRAGKARKAAGVAFSRRTAAERTFWTTRSAAVPRRKGEGGS